MRYPYLAADTHGFGCIVAVGNDAHTIRASCWNNDAADDHGIDACATTSRAAVAFSGYFRF